ncbi:hypothetical protein BK816_00385 [Boudabousia tangfeifanii]|uniref:ATPase AAA-type core domain-containing protein n=1 Tax=Boudabousia tangfeifanii TaxID=1912795 RepID=A0A1D9MI35_9ACTO|nr:AAA family ATPase [Boudabousia tangfeifanii]AOZ71936.1 hypothetical protein BK816_00385 [Boudabousia tangfeifanii]
MGTDQTKSKLAQITLANYGPFGETTACFSPALNVLVGNNAMGKSLFLKLLYASATALSCPDLQPEQLADCLAQKLVSVCRPTGGELSRLVSRHEGTDSAQIQLDFTPEAPHTTTGDSNQKAPLAAARDFQSLAFTIPATPQTPPLSVTSVPPFSPATSPVYLPSQEVISFLPGFLDALKQVPLPFPQTWTDAAKALSARALANPPSPSSSADKALTELEGVLGGRVTQGETGEFFLSTPTGQTEMPLVAEGMRKLASLAQLILNGAVGPGSCLFWDEPEANLNPSALQALCRALFFLAEGGTQLFVSTHSLFVLRELDLLSSQSRVPIRYVSLERSLAEGGDSGVELAAFDTLDDLESIASLDAELEQASRYLR